MEEELSYLQELMVEKDSLDPAFVHAQRLLSREISRVKELGDSVKTEEEGSDMNSQATSYNGKPTSPMAGSEPPNSSQDSQGKQPGSRKYRRPGEYVTEDVIKLSEKVIVPVKEFPKFNFVGKLLGPRGNTLKRLQAQTGTKMSVLGKGSMRDKEKEDELRDSGDPKYAHLTDPLHVLIEVEGVQSEAHLRLAGALSEIKKYMTPENDDIRVQQMQEMAYLQSLENHDTVPPLPPQMTAMTMTQIPIAAQPVVRGRARPVLRGAPAAMARGIRGVRAVRMPIPVSRSLGRAIVTHVAAPRHAAQAPGHYETYDPTYDSAYDAAYAEGATESVYYDYSGAEAYEYAPTSSAGFQTSTTYKAQPVRQMKRVAREATYPY
ncbi:KH domain-containing, RNA-binding, signal transduction-associated protein 2-like isoform X7 [Rhopilema esculentum]|uniref:KH domain-containing, RNA-binding, signal transduction-associated protein 2-like isoform X7 n=1 Tax=Rhopilema esculentum TaxID=499914 RepID=UPI0031DA24EF